MTEQIKYALVVQFYPDNKTDELQGYYKEFFLGEGEDVVDNIGDVYKDWTAYKKKFKKVKVKAALILKIDINQ
jgi:hypothetical protein